MKATRFTPVLLALVVVTAASPFRAAQAETGAWTDPPGDVPLPNADVLSGSATVAAGMVDLRVQFAARPFPATATHHITWCFDTDQDPSTGSACGSGELRGADVGFTLFGSLNALRTCEFSFSQGVPGLDAASHLWFDPATNTLRMLFPLSLLSDDGVFNYTVESAFGGSFGANERAPNSVGFGSPGGFFKSEAGELPPFNGILGCLNQRPVCSAAAASPAELGTPNHSLVPIEIVGVTDPDGDPVAIAVTGVTQDEPLEGPGHGSTCPDAVIEGGRASVRAERSGQGNDRVYVISFTATDDGGASCTGSVRVCVPHNGVSTAMPGGALGPIECQDDGQAVNSLGPCSATATHPAVSIRSDGLSLQGRATLEFSLPEEADVDLAVYDMLGRRAATLERSHRNAGAHQVEWSTSGLPAGTYFYRLRASGVLLSKPVVILH
jgi:hypothetical protein